MNEGRIVAFALVRLCIDTREGDSIGGTVYSPLLPGPLVFTDLGEMVSRLDAMMDAGYFPQAFMRLRTFQKRPPIAPLEKKRKLGTEEEREGEIATYIIRIKTRMQADWQGTVSREGGEERVFSGVLELLRMIDTSV